MTATVQPTGVAVLTRELAETRRAIADGERAWKDEHARLRLRVEQITEQRRIAMEGVSAAEQEAAERLVHVRGRISESAEGAFDKALNALAAGGGALRRKYIGAKRYDRFHQGVTCEYGYKPSHGSIVFAIGLDDEVRRRAVEGDELLTEDERELVVRYLLARKAAEASQ